MNPEFQRNLWLEASPRRIAWAAVVLVIIYGLAALAAKDGGLTSGFLSGSGMGGYCVTPGHKRRAGEIRIES